MLVSDAWNVTVPIFVPKSGSLTLTQEHLPGRISEALRAPGLSWVMLNREIQSPKISVSVVIDARTDSELKINPHQPKARTVISAGGLPLSTKFNNA